MNLYAYVEGNPVNAVDPEGLTSYVGPWWQLGGTAGGIILIAIPDPFTTYIGTGLLLGVAMSIPGDTCLEQRCAQQLDRDNATCDAIARAEKGGKRPRGAASRCYSSAMERYGNCLAERPIGPLDTWNN